MSSVFIIQLVMIGLLAGIVWDVAKLRRIRRQTSAKKIAQITDALPHNIPFKPTIQSILKKLAEDGVDDVYPGSEPVEQKKKELQTLFADKASLEALCRQVQTSLVPFQEFFLADIYSCKYHLHIEILNYKLEHLESEIKTVTVLYEEHIKRSCIAAMREKIIEQSFKNQSTEISEYVVMLNSLKARYPKREDKLVYLGIAPTETPSAHEVKLKIAQKKKEIKEVLVRTKNENKWKLKLVELEFLKLLRGEFSDNANCN